MKKMHDEFDSRFVEEECGWPCDDLRDFSDDIWGQDEIDASEDYPIKKLIISEKMEQEQLLDTRILQKTEKVGESDSNNVIENESCLKSCDKDDSENDMDSSSGNKISISKLATIIAKMNCIVLLDGVPHVYCNDLREYLPLSKNGDSSVLRGIIPDQYRGYFSRYSIPDFLEWLKVDDNVVKVADSVVREQAKEMVNFANTAVWIDSLEPAWAGKEQYFRRHVNADYPVGYESSGYYFDHFLDSVFGDDVQARRLFQEVLGYCFGDFRGAKKAFLFYGPSNTGKSVAGGFMRKLVGEEYTSSLTLSDLNSHFGPARLYGKFLNIGSEIDTSSRASGSIFKRLVGNDEISADVKFENGFDFVNTAAMVFLANSFPKFSVGENATSIAERFVIVPFLNIFERSDWILDLDEKTFSEGDYVVEFAMEGLKRLKNNNFVFSYCKTSQQLMKEYLIQAFPESQFIKMYLTANPNGKVATAELNRYYKKFCANYDLPFTSNIRWHEILSAEFNVKRARGISYGDNTDARGFAGVSFKHK